ncbi:MAG: radical SAM protein [Terriglobia bacterium]
MFKLPRPFSTSRRVIQLYLIKPSNYDDDGYVVSYFRGVLPSNTLNCLAALTEDVIRNKSLGDDIEIKVHLYDETVQRIPVKKICHSAQNRDQRVIVGLVGVQSNQFPRASDLARSFRSAGITVLIGGFHVSGLLSMIPGIPQDIQSLMDEGVTIVKGEVEETWGGLLADAVKGRLKPLYDFVSDSPDLRHQPIPLVNKRLMKRFMASNYGTIDCGRGCPFNCSFCTIINVQGRKMRVRSAEAIAAALRENWRRRRVNFYFFTDDNFARNTSWEEIFDALIALREKEKIKVQFMMQVDVLSYKIPNFVAKARQAGCTQVFIGMESINPLSLKDAGKAQNKAGDYVNLIRAWHDAEIATHVGFILGFPHDSAESLRQDIQTLMHEIKVEQASFFILIPLPGSRDHQEMVKRGEAMDPDYNKYDSMHEVMNFANFTEPGSLRKIYDEAWETFYSFDNMKRVLSNASARNYWNIMKNFIWYKNASLLEKRHPMMAGFLRKKSRKAMRGGVVVPGFWAFSRMRFRELRTYFEGMVKLIWEMQELWIQTRPRTAAEQILSEELRRVYASVERRLTVAELQLAYTQARAHFPSIQVPSKLFLYWQKWNLYFAKHLVYTREDIDRNWSRIRDRFQRRSIFGLSPMRFLTTLWLDFQVTALFAHALYFGRFPGVHPDSINRLRGFPESSKAAADPLARAIGLLDLRAIHLKSSMSSAATRPETMAPLMDAVFR